MSRRFASEAANISRMTGPNQSRFHAKKGYDSRENKEDKVEEEGGSWRESGYLRH